MSGLANLSIEDMSENMEVQHIKKPLWSRLISLISGLGILAGFCLIVFLVIGFVRFGNLVSSATNEIDRTHIETAQGAEKAEAIVVLTGGKDRILTAVSLLKQNKAARLLISGVHADTSKQSIAKMAGIPGDLMNCCVDIDRLAMDTKGNATQTEKWAKAHSFSRIIVVTSNYHMPRSLMEMRTAMPQAHLLPYQVLHNHPANGNWYSSPSCLRLIASEYIKYIATSFRKDFDHVEKRLVTYANAYLS